MDFENSASIVARSVAFAGAVALVLILPVAAFAAPPAYAPASHPVYRPAPATASHGRADTNEAFKAPFALNFHPQSQEFNPQPAWNPMRWHAWRPVPGSLLYAPMWYQLGCFADNGLSESPSSSAVSGASTPPKDFTIGSLADGHGSPFGASPSNVAKIASTGSATAPSNLLTLQSTTCGAVNNFNL